MKYLALAFGILTLLVFNLSATTQAAGLFKRQAGGRLIAHRQVGKLTRPDSGGISVMPTAVPSSKESSHRRYQ
jgi:hypothetical protein